MIPPGQLGLGMGLAKSGGTLLDPAAAAYMDGITVGSPTRVNALFAGLREIDLLDSLSVGLLLGSDFNDPVNPRRMDGTAHNDTDIGTRKYGYFHTAPDYTSITIPDEQQGCFVSFYQGYAAHPGTGSSTPTWDMRSQATLTHDTAFLKLTSPNPNTATKYQNQGPSQTVSTGSSDPLGLHVATRLQSAALNYNQSPRRWLAAEDGGAFVSEGAMRDFKGRTMTWLRPYPTEGMQMALFKFDRELTDTENADLHTLSRKTFYGRGIRLVVEGDSYTQGTGDLNLSMPAYLSSVSAMAGQISQIDNIGTGGLPISAGLTNSIADDWTANDPAAAFVATDEMPNRLFILWAGHNDWSRGDAASIIAGYDTVLSRAQELGMRTVAISTMHSASTSTMANVDTANAGIALLDSCDQFIDLHAHWKSEYGDPYYTDTDIFEGAGIHPSNTAAGGYQKAAEFIAANLELPAGW